MGLRSAASAFLALFCLCFWQPASEAAAPLMEIPGQMSLLPSPAAGDMQLPPGNFAQTPNVNSSGAFTYSIPIQVPPGTAGLAPNLALTYSSAGGDGSVGIGWGVSGLSVIARCPQTVVQDNQSVGVGYNGNDRFCLDGQRLMVLGGTYGASGSTYETELSNHTQIAYSGGVFTVTYPNGLVYEYGNTNVSADSAVPAYNSSPTITRLWALDKITDSKNGNYISFQYNYDTANPGLDYWVTEVDYTGNGSTAPNNAVCFGYTSRKDKTTGYQSGYELQPQYLLTTIKTYTLTGGGSCGSGGTERLVYTLTYNQADWTGGVVSSSWHNELNGITECDAVSKACLGSLSFTWQGDTWTLQSPYSNNEANGYALASGDFNGDGITDAFIFNTNSCQSGGQIYLGTGNGTTFDNGGTSATYNYATQGQYGPSWSQYSGSPACFEYAADGGPPWVDDFNGDGISDIMVSSGWAVGDQWNYATESVAGSASGSYVQANGEDANQVTDVPNFFVPGDMNGDGLTDFFSMLENDQTGTVTGYIYTSQGSNGTFTKSSPLSINGTASFFGGDFLGNGCTDIVSYLAGGTSDILGNCYGPLSDPTVTVDLPSLTAGQIVVGDFNGDGKSDVLGPKPNKSVAGRIG